MIKENLKRMIGLNNPLNIRYSSRNNWKGQIGQTRGFCDFRDSQYCIRACFLILMAYRSRGVRSYRAIISAYAPSFENNTEDYIRFVSKRLKKSSSCVPSSLFDFACLIRAMAFFEGNPLRCSSAEVFEILVSFGLKVVD